MPVKNIVSIIALSAVMLLPAGIATAGSVKINSSNGSRVRVYRNGGVKIKSGSGRVVRVRPRTYRQRRLLRNRAYRRSLGRRYSPYYRTNRKYPVNRKTWNSRCTGKTYQRTVRSRSGSNSSYSYSRTTSCQ